MTSLEVIRKRLKELREMSERATPKTIQEGVWFRQHFGSLRKLASDTDFPSDAACIMAIRSRLQMIGNAYCAGQWEEEMQAQCLESRTALPACLEAIEELVLALDRIESLSYLDEPVKMGEVASHALARAAELLNQTNERKKQ